jgi:hypothetical protein
MTMPSLAVYQTTLTLIGSSTSRWISALGMRGTAGTAVSIHAAKILPSDRCLAYMPNPLHSAVQITILTSIIHEKEIFI